MATTVRFGVFEADLLSRELRKRGVKVRLQEKPFLLLAALVKRPGEVVTREELRERLWSKATFVDFDNNLNTAVTKLREALGDSAESPRFIETLPKIGYRFLGLVDSTPVGQVRERRISLERAAVAVVVVAGAIGSFLLVNPIDLSSRKTSPHENERHRLVVLPFENLDRDASLDYFGDGLTEEVVTELGRLEPKRLGVISKTSAVQFRGRSIEEIGDALGVDFVLEGGVRRADDGVRVTARLIRVSKRAQVWAERYDRPWTDALSIQSHVTRDIVAALLPELLSGDEPSARAHATNAQAYDAYLKGLYQKNKSGVEALQTARVYFEEAIAHDPSYAPAHAALASTVNKLIFSGALSRGDGSKKARALAQRAIELDDSLPAAYLALANALFYFEWDFGPAGRAYERALAFGPGWDQSYYWATAYYSAVLRHDEALAAIERAVELNPASLSVKGDRGFYYIAAEQFDAAIQDCRRMIELEGELRFALDCLLRAHVGNGQLDEARLVARRLMLADGASPEELSLVSGEPGEAVERFWRWELESLREKAARGDVSDLRLSRQYALLQEKDEAFYYLERAIETRDPYLVFIRSDARLKSLRDDARFGQLVRRVAPRVSLTHDLRSAR